MLLATTVRGLRQTPARSGERGTCPLCANAVLGKCGTLVQWHWAHEALIDCDPWGEPETEWHRTWKERFPAKRREIIIGSHRADVVTARGWILEFQHSPLSVAEIAEREREYGRKLIWIVDGRSCAENFNFRKTTKHGPTVYNRIPVSFRWKWPRKTWTTADRPVFIDIGSGRLLRIHWVKPETPCGGWGTLTYAGAFVNWAEHGLPPFRPFQPGEQELQEAIFDEQRRREYGDIEAETASYYAYYDMS